ncbi:16S rRNA (guanine(966)-N(2))-methyltransferase RsmD [Mycoplasmopsis arginini]|uniref:16S rRNA (guanine(966)-N(2))-methyltransferase RsmD n=1 Tax=Mycoplasmopsis arginini TaxID=2094 RepID=UPI00227B9769|nr:16S rRNA (guanine(966)-N(2))-methyltransferase RsmD [Mycoplasmopsis arginini]MCY2902721.1 16S rRNA (guanine(966)-N(2))-methyltransferase RsmD [Mycoplasmopsis arginini QMP CG1-2758]MDI3350194.1 16S rRNA (guanine(966)-N(2))-methyltransferase RsmD [Mycoplasmopsis arginini]MDI3351022.1 16S rRNA (guanine(966)-N(2))-methyltransferase RsmD [Mycoplasmopsis arginini]MDI3352303.1 16S rRNA (guanine(966)-N(2))-methyltransferase RsmD [Mycoplasmopsis arginini]
MLRIIAGKYRSRILKQPSKTTTRPTVDRAKEAIFSSIQFDIEGKEFLDIFSGSGSFCLEALSRGAKKATCVEKDRAAYKIILENKANLNEENLQVFNTDALTFLQKNLEKKFDFVYLDPPFIEKELLVKCIDILTENVMIKLKGQIIVETDWQDFLYEKNGFEIVKMKKYGKIYIYFIRRKS